MSAEDEARKKAAHLDEWLLQAQVIRDLTPEVQRQREETEWMISAAARLDKQAPPEVRSHVAQQLARDVAMTRQHLPLPTVQIYVQPTTVLTSTSTAAASAVVFTALSDLNSLRWKSPEAQAEIDRYMALQEKRGKVEDARSRLAQHLPGLVSLFDEARKCVAIAKVNEADVPRAAGEVRTLLEKMRAELFAKARIPGNPRENMTWPEMADRLTASNTALQQTLIDQESARSDLISDLSEILKRRSAPDKERFSTVWVAMVDHIYITCGCL